MQSNKDPRQLIGYENRRLNIKKQTYNGYLDGTIATKTSQSIISGVDTLISGYTYNKTGNFDFTKGSTDKIIVPINGTYMVIANFQWLDLMPTGNVLHWIDLNGSHLYSSSVVIVDSFNTYQMFGIENLVKGDELTARVFHVEGSNKNIKVQLSITKIS